MPPHRRRPNTPARRPKVAGLRNRPESPREPTEPTEEPVSGVLDGVIGAEPVAEPEKPAPAPAPKPRTKPRLKPEPKAETEPATEPAPRSKSEPAPTPKPRAKTEPKSRPPKPQPAPAGGARPAGKRRATGTARPADLKAAEASTESGANRKARHAKPAAKTPPSAAQRQLSVALVLAVIAVILTGLAIFFRGKATDLNSADSNTALTDPAATSQVISQISNAIKTTFSYNYTDLDSTAKAVKETLTGKALCEYNLLFEEVIRFAPEQKLILATTVREIALVRLDGDRAEALVYFDQSSTRVDTNKSATAGGQFVVMAFRDGKNWKINEFDMFGQPLPGNKPAPKC